MNPKSNKTKLLGQVFSGSLVAKTIAHFIQPKSGLSVVDPMCGIGDLLLPYLNICEVHGIEIDTDLKKQLELRGLGASVAFANTFGDDGLSYLESSGYDIVVTNPPYIRKENLQNSDSTQLPLEQMKSNLISFVQKRTNLNSHQKDEVVKTIVNLSGLTDIAALAWILCMTIVKDGGLLGIVVSNSWLTREYAKPIKHLLLTLFDIQVIINDVNNLWFKQRAQVKTNIVICKKRNSSEILTSHPTKIYSLYSSFDYGNLDCIDSDGLWGVEKM